MGVPREGRESVEGGRYQFVGKATVLGEASNWVRDRARPGEIREPMSKAQASTKQTNTVALLNIDRFPRIIEAACRSITFHLSGIALFRWETDT